MKKMSYFSVNFLCSSSPWLEEQCYSHFVSFVQKKAKLMLHIRMFPYTCGDSVYIRNRQTLDHYFMSFDALIMAGLRPESGSSFDRFMHSAKPLPPIPRRPSSAYSMSTMSTMSTISHFEEDIPYDRRILDDYLTKEQVYLQPKTYRSSTSNIPDPVPARPKLLHMAQSYMVSGAGPEQGRVNNTQSEDYEISPCTPEDAEAYHDHKPRANAKGMDDAQWHAKNFESVLHSRSSVWHSTVPDQYYPHHGKIPPPMSPRITDVVDHSLVPTALSSNTVDKKPEPESRFSSDSSDASSHRGSLRDSIRKTARKAFQSQKDSTGSRNSEHLVPPSKSKSRLGSESSGGRMSLQLGIEDMYDTLTSFYPSSAKSRPATPKAVTSRPSTPRPVTKEAEKASGVRRPNQHRTPAIPLSPYQKFGPAAWETDSQSSKTSKLSFLTAAGKKAKETATKPSALSSDSDSAKRKRSKDQKKASLADRLASRLQNGTERIEHAMGLETDKVKRSRSQKKREDLKKKIVVVGLGDREQAGGGRWV